MLTHSCLPALAAAVTWCCLAQPTSRLPLTSTPARTPSLAFRFAHPHSLPSSSTVHAHSLSVRNFPVRCPCQSLQSSPLLLPSASYAAAFSSSPSHPSLSSPPLLLSFSLLSSKPFLLRCPVEPHQAFHGAQQSAAPFCFHQFLGAPPHVFLVISSPTHLLLLPLTIDTRLPRPILVVRFLASLAEFPCFASTGAESGIYFVLPLLDHFDATQVIQLLTAGR